MLLSLCGLILRIIGFEPSPRSSLIVYLGKSFGLSSTKVVALVPLYRETASSNIFSQNRGVNVDIATFVISPKQFGKTSYVSLERLN